MTHQIPLIPSFEERFRRQDELLVNIRGRLPELEALLAECEAGGQREDLLYRFWHQSLKVYILQRHTEQIRTTLESLSPNGCTLHPWFATITSEGTGKKFTLEHNDDWLSHTRPIVEAFFHAEYMLRMAIRYGNELETAPTLLPSGWAALLTLYGIR